MHFFATKADLKKQNRQKNYISGRTERGLLLWHAHIRKNIVHVSTNCRPTFKILYCSKTFVLRAYTLRTPFEKERECFSSTSMQVFSEISRYLISFASSKSYIRITSSSWRLACSVSSCSCIHNIPVQNVSKTSLRFSYLRTLTTWHCPHSPAARRCCSNRSPLRQAHSSKPASGTNGQIDGETDGRTPYRFTDPAPHTMRAVPMIHIIMCA